MLFSKGKIAASLVLMLGLFAAGLGLLAPLSARPQEQAKPGPAPARQKAPAVETKDRVTFRGRVIDADGKPVRGAAVRYHFITREEEPSPVRATTDADGRFAFTLTRKDVPLSADVIGRDPLRTGQVLVGAEGFTFAWALARQQHDELTLRVTRGGTPVEGRILDLEGRPIEGVRVRVMGVLAPEKGDLSDFLKALERRETLYQAAVKSLPRQLQNPIIGRDVSALLPSATTDAAGRFTIRGFDREQLVELRIEGPRIETQNVYVATRAGGRRLTTPRIKDPFFGPSESVTVLENRFDLPVAPGQVVVGTVRDAATRKPIAEAVVESYSLAGIPLAQNTIYRVVSDGEGHYRFPGLPRGKGNRIRFRSPKDQPYLPVVKAVTPSETFRPAKVDVELQRGVWVDVTTRDATTGEPVPGYVSYFVLPQTEEKALPEGRFSDAYNNMMPIRNDGTFRFVAVPRRAILAFRADWDRYPIAKEAATIRLPSGLSPSNFQAFASIDPKPGEGPVKVRFVVDAGHVVKGRLVDPDGRPVRGALPAGLRDDWFWGPDRPLPTDQFTALGLSPGRPRLLGFVHWEKKLAGSVVVRGDEKEPVMVRLRPFATVSGRLLSPDGKPVKNATLRFTSLPVGKPGEPRQLDAGLHVVERTPYRPSRDPRTDEDGRFRAEGLIPGLKYNLAVVDATGATNLEQVKWEGLAFANLVLRPGENKDLGGVKMQPFPKK